MSNRKTTFPDNTVFEKGDYRRIRRLQNDIRLQNIFNFICKMMPILCCVYLLLCIVTLLSNCGIMVFLTHIVEYLMAAMVAFILIRVVMTCFFMYIPMIVIPLGALLIVVFIVNGIRDGSTLGRADILAFCGDFLAFAGTFCLGYYIYIQDKNKWIEEKKTNIKRLIATIEKLDIEMLRLSKHNLATIINYDAEWLTYYLDYESLRGSDSDLKCYFERYFRHVDSINQALANGKISKAEQLEMVYLDDLNYSIYKYNHLEALSRLSDSLHKDKFFDSICWLENKKTVDLINGLCREYYYIIETYIYNWMLKNNRSSVKIFDIEHELTDWLVENSPEIRGVIRFRSERRIVCKVIHDCSLCFSQKSKKIDYVWAEYSLKN